ncbi:pyridoxamine 5'-phosphate oxidase family protein [Chitinophaga sp. Cy-1792]|uniref:pyridoxamine 5'-phosphate oxidase family protein n=1 Tax=Chitinophaga sp. Cy-1792 TaxID=2608339 RepID=UPI001421139B|nr:pyridoxamine 5'-phosphate oxidase family protein [Chitinophaga sp. Cy-1792]NIG54066.1 pyridoxamine 5'-phosphate oxidase family protein [Chitinophaga sp. Cy-1792]
MTTEALYHYLQSQHLAVVSSVSSAGMPQSAVVGIAVSPQLELIFDTVSSSRKYINLIANANIAVVIGWDNETTVQLEGIASLLPSGEAHPLKDIYFHTFHDARQRADTWPDLVHFVITPHWIRYSNFNELNNPVQEWDLK